MEILCLGLAVLIANEIWRFRAELGWWLTSLGLIGVCLTGAAILVLAT